MRRRHAAGVTLDVAFAENNAVVQIQQVFERVHRAEGERPRAIVLHSVTGEGLQRVARNAVGSGIGWIVLNRRVGYVEELRRERPDLPIAMVSPDQVEIGRIQGRQVKALARRGGMILYLQGPADTSSAQDRLQGSREILGECLRVEGSRGRLDRGRSTTRGGLVAAPEDLRTT